VGAALTTTGRSGTARQAGPGKQDGKVHECRNQWWNPLKSVAGSNLVDVGRTAVHAHLGGRLRSLDVRADEEATVNACGVTVARLQGKSWAPTPSNGWW
jgi:hypothetical protein